MWGLREEKKERKDQNVELRRLHNRCFIHSIDLFCVYLTFAKMPIKSCLVWMATELGAVCVGAGLLSLRNASRALDMPH